MRSIDAAGDRSLRLSSTHPPQPACPSGMALVERSLNLMLACTETQPSDCILSYSPTCKRSATKRSPSKKRTGDGLPARSSPIKTHTGTDLRVRRSRRARCDAMCSTQVSDCPLTQLPCLDVSSVDQSDNISPRLLDEQVRIIRSYPASKAARVRNVTATRVTKLDGVDKRRKRNLRCSRAYVGFTEQQEERRLRSMAKPCTVTCNATYEVSEPESPCHDSPVLVPLAPPATQSTSEPAICIPLSGSQTFTHMPRQKQNKWDVRVLYESNPQPKQRKVRKLYTQTVLDDYASLPATRTNDNSKKRKSRLTNLNEETHNNQPDDCTLISSSSEQCTPVLDVDDAANPSGNTISSSGHNDSVESSQLDSAAVQRLEVIVVVVVTSFSRSKVLFQQPPVLGVVLRCRRRSKSMGTHSQYASWFGVHRSRRGARRCNPTDACPYLLHVISVVVRTNGTVQL